MPEALMTIHGAGLAGGPRGCARGRNDSMRTIWPRQYFGQSRNDRPIRRSYRSRQSSGSSTGSGGGACSSWRHCFSLTSRWQLASSP